MNLTYEKCGDYLIPNLIPDPEPDGELRKFGLMRKQYLKEYKIQCFSEQEELVPALMETRPAAVWVIMEKAAGMEGVIAVRRIYPDLPVIWL